MLNEALHGAPIHDRILVKQQTIHGRLAEQVIEVAHGRGVIEVAVMMEGQDEQGASNKARTTGSRRPSPVRCTMPASR